MKIESAAAYRLYKTYTPSGASGESTSPAGRTEAAPQKTDKLSISGQAASRVEIGRLAQDIAAQMETAAPADRLQALKNAVESGEYYVPTAQLADAMLNVWG